MFRAVYRLILGALAWYDADMTDSQTAPTRRTYRRRDAMSASLTVNMTVEMREAVETEAIADGVSAADVIRMAMSDALPRMRERRRKRAGRASGRHGRPPAPDARGAEAGK